MSDDNLIVSPKRKVPFGPSEALKKLKWTNFAKSSRASVARPEESELLLKVRNPSKFKMALTLAGNVAQKVQIANPAVLFRFHPKGCDLLFKITMLSECVVRCFLSEVENTGSEEPQDRQISVHGLGQAMERFGTRPAILFVKKGSNEVEIVVDEGSQPSREDLAALLSRKEVDSSGFTLTTDPIPTEELAENFEMEAGARSTQKMDYLVFLSAAQLKSVLAENNKALSSEAYLTFTFGLPASRYIAGRSRLFLALGRGPNSTRFEVMSTPYGAYSKDERFASFRERYKYDQDNFLMADLVHNDDDENVDLLDQVRRRVSEEEGSGILEALEGKESFVVSKVLVPANLVSVAVSQCKDSPILFSFSLDVVSWPSDASGCESLLDPKRPGYLVEPDPVGYLDFDFDQQYGSGPSVAMTFHVLASEPE